MTDSREIVLKVHALSLSLSGRSILDQINLNLFRKDIYGLLGPNGSGKTTLFKAITGLLWPSGGTIHLLNQLIHPLRKKGMSKVGSVVGAPSFYEFLTAKQYLEFILSLRKTCQSKTIQKVLRTVGLESNADEKIKCFSDGMKQRLAIAQALAGGTEILILDEPFRGLDSFGINDIWKILNDLNKNASMTILFSSHVTSIAETHCTRIGIIDGGKLLFEGEKKIFVEGKASLEQAYSDLIHNEKVLRKAQ